MENPQIPPSTNAILTAARSMPIAELERLIDQVIAIRAERVAPHLTAEQSRLLSRINQGLPGGRPSITIQLLNRTFRTIYGKSNRNPKTSLRAHGLSCKISRTH
jgi:hypothetical protein